jgi:hypothetical protein
MMNSALVRLINLDMAYYPASQVEKVWIKKDETIYPLEREWTHLVSEVSPCLGFWFLNPIACQVCLHSFVNHVLSYSCFAF